MKQVLSSFARGPGLTIFAVLIFALAAFVLFSALSQPAASPSTVATAPPTPTSTASPRPSVFPSPLATYTPAPLPPTRVIRTATPGPTFTPVPLATTFPPTVTNWLSFQGVKTGFSFLYPAGWDITENSVVFPAYSSKPQVVIAVTNYERGNGPGQSVVPSGAIKIEILSNESSVPPGGTPFAVGTQQFPGVHFLVDYTNPAESHGLVGLISIYFTAGQRQWAIGGYFSPPKDAVSKHTEIFYQIIRSLRYDGK